MYRILSALCCIIGLSLGRQPDAPHHSSDHLPNTAFSCRDKVLGGYYADPDAQCQMFHVCVKVAGVGIQDFRFLCPNGTAFDQEAQICAGWADVACEPAALYYSSDNFDLYRIGSGFESKKAPSVSEEEQDFHLQRAEPDILSGAHSSNFFNNREGKDIDDPKPKIQNRNQVDQQPKRKVVKKLQRRPVETTISYTTTTQRIFTNNFAGSFVPTTSLPSTFASSSQAPQYNAANDYQKTNYYQQTKQTYETPKPTQAPVEVKKVEQVNYSDNRSFRQRPENTQVLESSTNNYNSNQNSYNNNQNNNNYYNSNNQNNYDRTRQQNRRTHSNRQHSDNNNYSSTIKSSQQTDRAFVNRGRGQQTYQNIRTTQKPSSVTETYNQPTEKQIQYTNGNSDNKKHYQQLNNQQSYNQQSTQTYNTNNNNYRNENEQQTTYKIKYSSVIPTQTTPQYNQQYENNNFKQFSNPANYEQLDKKPSTKSSEKKSQYSAQTKQTTAGFENYNKNQGSGSSQQTQASSSSQHTPAPKFNTNLLYDNNQQSTPDYYSQTNQQFKSNPNKAQNVNQQFAPVVVPEYNQPQRKSTTFEQQPTIQPSTYNPGKNNYQNQPSYDKSKLQQHYSTTKTPSSVIYNQKYEPRSSTISYKNSEYDDGQYRPEFYEREAGGEYDVNSKQNSNKRVFVEQKEAPEQEFLKTAHSINIAASGNKLAKENQRLNAIAQTTSTKQQYYQPRDNQNKNYYNVPSSTTSSNSVQYNENQYQNHRAPIPSAAPAKPQYNYEENQRNNNYFSQSSTQAPSNIQYQVNAKSQSSSTPVAPFSNPQYNVKNDQRQNYYSPSSTNQPEKQYFENKDFKKANTFSQSARQYTQDVTASQPPRTQHTTDSPRSVYSSFAAVTSEAPRPFSLRTETSPVASQPKKQHVSKKAPASSLTKPVTSKSKDVSYDYAYYDTSDHYSEYDNIEEDFGRTSKKQ